MKGLNKTNAQVIPSELEISLKNNVRYLNRVKAFSRSFIS